MRELLRGNPDVAKERNEEGTSALLVAQYYGREEIAAELRAAAQELDVFEAATYGDVERLGELIQADPSLVNAWAPDGFQPLGLACFFGRTEAARLLLERGAEVNSASRNQMEVMPLHSAAAASDPEARYEIARLLLEAGADSNARQRDEFTPLMAAEQQGDERLRELLEG